MKKFEIIIEPEDKEYCGNCTYKEIGQFKDLIAHAVCEDWYCMLFDKSLCRWIANIEQPVKPERCRDCRDLTERFEEMKELDMG